ncbi:MAG: hypothetical protein QXY26_08435 [Ignisphaera sp.]
MKFKKLFYFKLLHLVIMDPLIKLLKEKPDALKILCSAWNILYIEGHGPDVGKRRENLLRMIFEKELGLKVDVSSSTERGWDISVTVGKEKRMYSVKTSEGLREVKVAWNGYPSIERAKEYKFTAPILYVIRDRSNNEISVFVFELEDIKKLREELGDNMWWIPKEGTNPRGFGLSKSAIEKLIDIAKNKDNYVSCTCQPVDLKKIAKDYWDGWYNLVKNLALKYKQ